MLEAWFCREKAEECELLAAECRDPALRREWLDMADDWREAAGQAESREPEPHGEVIPFRPRA